MNNHARFQVSAVVYLRPWLFWDFAWHRLALLEEFSLDCLSLHDGTDMLSRKVGDQGLKNDPTHKTGPEWLRMTCISWSVNGPVLRGN